MIETIFKHTDIGLIPHDWEVKTILSVIDECNYGVGAEAIKYNGGAKYLRITDIDDGSHHYSPKPLTSPAFYDECHLAKSGDMFVARTGASVGKSYLYHPQDGKLVYAGFLIKVHISKANPYYVFLNTLTQRYSNWVISESARTGQPGLNAEQLKTLLIPLPPTLAEQERIAGALSSIDTLIGALNEQIEKKRHIKQGTMQQLLTGKKRLAGFTGEWIEKTIEELGILTGAGVDKKSSEDETPIRLVNYLDVFKRDYIFQKELDFWVTANEGKKHQCNVLKGDIFFTPSSEMPYDIALSALAMEDMPNVCYSYHIYRLRLNEDIDFLYRAYMFKSDSFYSQANQTCEGSGKRYVISLSKFKQMTVTYPSSKKEQRAIANILSSMDTEITNLEQKRDKYMAIKQGMMQNLLTGKIRLI